MNKYSSLLLALSIIFLTGCDSGPDSPKGFSLPKGDIASGNKVYVKHQCVACHSLEGDDASAIKPELEKRIKLGGEKARVITYAELVTSIINPSHRIATRYKANFSDELGQSTMRNYNDVMTVTELIDLVAYLQPHYKLKPFEYTTYGRYY